MKRYSSIGIIGGSGFVGSHIAEFLIKKGLKVTIYDIKKPKIDQVQYTNLDITKDDLSNLKDHDIIIHTAIIQIPLINEEPALGYKVNIIGLERVLKTISTSEKVKGFILTSSWHVYGEYLEGEISEEYGYHPERVAKRARLYVYSKIAQEIITKYYAEMHPQKKFIILRLGTVLGKSMPKKTAANIFITNALQGKPITPYKESMYRPMFYVDIKDVTNVVWLIVKKILENDSLKHNTFNVFYPIPITILDLANIIYKEVYTLTKGRINPRIQIVNTRKDSVFPPDLVKKIHGNITKLQEDLHIASLTSPEKSLREIIAEKLKVLESSG